MNFMQVSEALAMVASGDMVYLYTQPEVLDFTSNEDVELVICCNGDEYTFTLDKDTVQHLWSRLQFSVFAAGKKVIGWNLKNLFSYFRYYGNKDFKADCSLIDLKVIESYLGISQKRPHDYVEAFGRVRHIFSSGHWKDVQPIYKRIHLPLITKVLPVLEATGLLDNRLQAAVYAYYEIDGTANGRMKTPKMYGLGFTPHSMGESDREAIMPRNPEDIFMYFDFSNQEVAVLQWLTGDKKLEEMLRTPDVYATIYEAVIGKKCEEGKRDVAKMFFLPVIYGMSSVTLSEKLGISEGTAHVIVARVNELFGTATDWIGGHQQKVETAHVARDYYGRRREFPDAAYLVRNFMVQAPASTICLEKLINLQRRLPVIMHVHDGYYVLANKKNWLATYKTAKEILEAESDLCPGLKLKVKCNAGRNLNRLKPIGKKGTE